MCNIISMEKMILITPHLSTGGAPQFTLNKIELLKSKYDIYCIEYNFISLDYVIQRNKIKKILGDSFYSLGDNKEELLSIIDKVKPNYIWFEEIPETFIMNDIIKDIHSCENYKILETTHSSVNNTNLKTFLPDKFIFVTPYSEVIYKNLGIETTVIEYPVDEKEKKQIDSIEKLGLDKDYKHIVNIGLFTSGKNQGYAFDIAREMVNEKVKFHFIGNMAENFKEYWQPLLENKPENCIIWGERDDVDTFLQASDLFLFTSKFELNPLVVKEALSYKLPILMFNIDKYMGKYDDKDDIGFLTNEVKYDIENITKILICNNE